MKQIIKIEQFDINLLKRQLIIIEKKHYQNYKKSDKLFSNIKFQSNEFSQHEFIVFLNNLLIDLFDIDILKYQFEYINKIDMCEIQILKIAG